MRREDREDMTDCMERCKQTIFHIDQFIAANPNNHIMDNNRQIINNIMMEFQNALRNDYVIEWNNDQFSQISLAENLLNNHYPAALATLSQEEMRDIINRLRLLTQQTREVYGLHGLTEEMINELCSNEYALRVMIIHLSYSNIIFQWEIDYINARIVQTQRFIDNPSLNLNLVDSTIFSYYQNSNQATLGTDTQEITILFSQPQAEANPATNHTNPIDATSVRQPSFIENFLAPIREFFGNIFHPRANIIEEHHQDLAPYPVAIAFFNHEMNNNHAAIAEVIGNCG